MGDHFNLSINKTNRDGIYETKIYTQDYFCIYQLGKANFLHLNPYSLTVTENAATVLIGNIKNEEDYKKYGELSIKKTIYSISSNFIEPKERDTVAYHYNEYHDLKFASFQNSHVYSKNERGIGGEVVLTSVIYALNLIDLSIYRDIYNEVSVEDVQSSAYRILNKADAKRLTEEIDHPIKSFWFILNSLINNTNEEKLKIQLSVNTKKDQLINDYTIARHKKNKQIWDTYHLADYINNAYYDDTGLLYLNAHNIDATNNYILNMLVNGKMLNPYTFLFNILLPNLSISYDDLNKEFKTIEYKYDKDNVSWVEIGNSTLDVNIKFGGLDDVPEMLVLTDEEEEIVSVESGVSGGSIGAMGICKKETQLIEIESSSNIMFLELPDIYKNAIKNKTTATTKHDLLNKLAELYLKHASTVSNTATIILTKATADIKENGEALNVGDYFSFYLNDERRSVSDTPAIGRDPGYKGIIEAVSTSFDNHKITIRLRNVIKINETVIYKKPDFEANAVSAPATDIEVSAISLVKGLVDIKKSAETDIATTIENISGHIQPVG